MDAKKKFILWAAALFAVLVIGSLGYRLLSAGYTPDAPVSDQMTKTADPDGEQEAPYDQSDADMAPDFTIFDADGEEVHLSDYAGSPVILNFWATWCGPCRSELGEFDEAYKQYGDRIQFLMVDLTDGVQETQTGAQQFVEDNAYSFPVFFDTNASAAQNYGIYAIPMTVAVKADGTVGQMQVGALSGEVLQGMIEDVLAQ